MSYIIHASAPTVLYDNPASVHNYAGWPSVTQLRDGRLAAVYSGFRLQHVCPFGKSVMQISENEGETWSLPMPVIDTLLDDRDSGICAFGKSSVIVTSFNNTPSFQRATNEVRRKQYASENTEEYLKCHQSSPLAACDYVEAYLKYAEAQPDTLKHLGSTFRISNDNGVTFGDIHTIPVSSPHGPLELPDGTLYYVGTRYATKQESDTDTEIDAYRIFPDGTYEKVCTVARSDKLFLCEPHAILLPSGKIIVHIRVQQFKNIGEPCFTVYQCESTDGGKSYTEPHRILGQFGGSPAHLYLAPDGTLMSVYGYRVKPYGLRVMFSRDEGETWDTDNILYAEECTSDLGYPCTTALKDGSFLTVFYAHGGDNTPALIRQIKWTFEYRA